MSYLLNHLGSIWYHSKLSDAPYSLNHSLGWDFFAASYSKTALESEYDVGFNLILLLNFQEFVAQLLQHQHGQLLSPLLNQLLLLQKTNCLV